VPSPKLPTSRRRTGRMRAALTAQSASSRVSWQRDSFINAQQPQESAREGLRWGDKLDLFACRVENRPGGRRHAQQGNPNLAARC